MNIFKKITKWLFGATLIFLLYVATCLIHGTLTDYQPPEVLELGILADQQPKVIQDSILSFLNWNIGYAGLGAKSNFFYDNGNPFFFSGGKMIRSPKALVEENMAGISQFIKSHPTDFVLLQEVDQNSKRSYYINQYETYQALMPNYSSSFALNYKVERVIIPVCEPWHVMGQMQSGLSTYSKYQPSKSTRFQFPGSYGWPDYIFHLDRCMSVQRFPTSHPDGKELLVINTHHSAYDGGKLKESEMAYFKQLVLDEYKKGNYIIVGGDFNQTPPKVAFDAASKAAGIESDSSYFPANIEADFMPEDWTWAYDPTVPTNRNMADKLDYGKTGVSLVDFYLLSPNVELVQVKGENLKFEHSDHNPVLLEVKLKGLNPTDSTILALPKT